MLRQQVRRTARGHTACASVRTRSARPTCPPRVISSAANHTSRPSSAPAATAETLGRSPPGTEDPRLRPPSGQAVRAMKPIVAQNACAREPPLAGSGVRRDQYAGYTASDQDEPSGRGGRPERQARYDIADTHRQQHERHHPPVGSTIGRQGADGARYGVERARLQPGSNGPSADQKHGSGGRRDHTPPGHHPARPPP
jgi:hypothetical protein